MSTDSTQSEGPSLVRLRTGSATLVGQVRAGNEDSLLVSADLLAVADGMGGHQAGEVASAET
ncbi:MAG: protein phosphatase, partial [Actinobacteria bacterium]|nr:protein phosphatase [Actinomycetota bacterium]